ncbi:beta-ketoacyl synthase chain length factor [Phytohabitans rumicis]|uniref:beta-ketoacyl synthase chain length factor n=1 Tax=Phytohabitans rumicis TaxID=1076125 RepID=UPI001565447B|nr:beta-ketoacyl synthase chain length factor [Phytohabitans rumicis]
MDELAGVAVRSRAQWPEPGDTGRPGQVPGFVASSFGPLVAEVAERCLRGWPTNDTHTRTAVVLASVRGDLGTATAVAEAVDAGRRVTPLFFFQSVPNSILGHIAARWRLTGPLVCLSPIGDPLAEAAAVAAGLFDDGDADEALLIVADQGSAYGGDDTATALLVGPADSPHDEGVRQ